jgi:hypothetical protein
VQGLPFSKKKKAQVPEFAEENTQLGHTGGDNVGVGRSALEANLKGFSMAIPALKNSDFIRRSASYVRAAVRSANSDKNPYLTKAEAKGLPKDLQDNFKNHRVGAQANGVVTAKKFEQRYTDYVAVNVKKADKDGDGWVTSLEVKNLPKDLRDNFWNAWRNR